ncbi:MAG: hypothetical protein DU480_04635 [Nitrosomonas sp.]|uniref:hypothetical protein n=1 Tax=Nitrosomonas sp. TaxID=42353 RepID=UPI0032EB7BCD
MKQFIRIMSKSAWDREDTEKNLQELGGWESEEMIRAYAQLSKLQLMQHAKLVSNVLDDTTASHQKEKRG